MCPSACSSHRGKLEALVTVPHAIQVPREKRVECSRLLSPFFPLPLLTHFICILPHSLALFLDTCRLRFCNYNLMVARLLRASFVLILVWVCPYDA